jgi:RNA polymerase sigma-70 factor (ECF subfamily)
MESTGALVMKAQSGDRGAFDELMRRFSPRLEAQIRSRMGGKVRSLAEVEDILNETFACAFESIGKLEWRGEETFYRWLASIGEHLIRNVSRKRDWSPLQIEKVVPASDASPSKKLRREDRFDRLEESLNRLSPDHRKALVLSRIHGLSVKEISRKMDRSPEAVKKLLARALAQLRESFGDTESLHLPDRTFEAEGVEGDA